MFKSKRRLEVRFREPSCGEDNPQLFLIFSITFSLLRYGHPCRAQLHCLRFRILLQSFHALKNHHVVP